MSGYNALWVPGMDHAGIATQVRHYYNSPYLMSCITINSAYRVNLLLACL